MTQIAVGRERKTKRREIRALFSATQSNFTSCPDVPTSPLYSQCFSFYLTRWIERKERRVGGGELIIHRKKGRV